VLDGTLENRQDVDLDLSLSLDLSGRGGRVEETLSGLEGSLDGLFGYEGSMFEVGRGEEEERLRLKEEVRR